ncbi:hypothetical protein LTR56_015189 [Elasticomyces elasticus]|nr:hypothetical protein LTR56_015189 [Elasticomyces elasticus]KAK3644483.1 hypothetical protein LTR22_015203 [Elasticomyces elasticus]KAK4915520.1 hypothetical protein LTR49_016367 [Elasticomyces elasticus]KAK5756237.1 hypothetical protein LTS12_013661 [Elasticomyces elasticus]
MSLVALPIEHGDVSQCIDIRVAALGSLVIGQPPSYPGYVEGSIATVHNDLDDKPWVHHLKVVDRSAPHEVMAYAKWEIYSKGRPDLDMLREPMDPNDALVDDFGLLRKAAHEYFSHCNGEMGKRPHILLALLVTSSQHRRKGAGSLLVQWDLAMSDESGLPAYLEASEAGRRLYRLHGFAELSKVEFNLTGYGLNGIEVMTEMLRYPSTRVTHTNIANQNLAS